MITYYVRAYQGPSTRWHEKFLHKFLFLKLRIIPVLLQFRFGRGQLFVFFPQIAKSSPEGRRGELAVQALACPRQVHCQCVLSMPGHATKEQQGMIPRLAWLFEAQSDTSLDEWLG